ncbi:response regulator [Paenibacillus sp. GCM10027628]|uniref:response regulator transcription factor n=1 Tax=Paenibacillus sp. GCM10027628 TaxID=3273413 RepID=UPI0036327053
MHKLLLVDDDYITREGLRDLIDWKSLGIKIAGEAEDGAEALRIARTIVPDLVITDVVMPGMDGIKLVEALKIEHPDLMVIMISAHQDIQYVKASIKLDAIDYLLKPFNREEMMQVVGKVIGRMEKEREYKRLKDDISHYYVDSTVPTELTIIVDLRERIVKLTGSGLTETLIDELKQFFASIRLYKMDSILILAILCSELLIKAFRSAAAIIGHEAAKEMQDSLQQFRMMQSSTQIETFVFEKLLHIEQIVNESRNNKSRKVIRIVEAIIRKSYNQNLTIQQLAEEVYMSAGHLQGLFKKETGQTINEYITMVRLEKAQELLRDPAIRIYEVANLVGYQDTYYFTKIFKKLVGVIPVQFRERG